VAIVYLFVSLLAVDVFQSRLSIRDCASSDPTLAQDLRARLSTWPDNPWLAAGELSFPTML
jgi:hypothetical protein